MFSENFDAFIQLFLGNIGCSAQNYGFSKFDLVGEKFAEVFHIHLALIRVNDGYRRIQSGFSVLGAHYRLYYVAEFADARRLDKYSVGFELFKHLGKRLFEVADKAAADTARVHLVYLYARLL